MKKFLAILLSALLVAAVFAIPASAATWQDNQVVDDKGDYTFDNAYGYVFKVNHFNTAVNETITISTSEEGYGTSNPNWAINVLLCPTDDANVYTVGKVVVCPQSPAGGIDAGINFDNGNIAMVVHSAYSNPNGANWEAKVAAMALKEGDKVTLADINVADETLGDNPTITVQDDPAGAAPVAGENVAAGKTYTIADQFRQGSDWGWDENADIVYLDETGSMTDGVIAATDSAYSDAVWAGWNANTPGYSDVGYAWITIDLGEATDLAKFVAYIGASGLGSGIGANNMTVAVAVSNDGENFEVVGETVPVDDASVSVIATEIALDKAVNAQYVQFRFARGGWMFVSEVEVYNAVAGSEEVPAGPIYVEKVVSSYKDYTTSPLFRQNESYEWGIDAPIAYPDDERAEEMTNGAVATFQPEWGDFFNEDVNAPVIGFHGNTPAFEEDGVSYPSYADLGYAWIRVDLGAVSSLNKLSAYIHNMDANSSISKVTFVVSEDGETWTEAGSVETPDLGDQDAVLELEEAVSAQYVEYRFTATAYWMFVSEVKAIEVVERNTVNDATAPVTGTETPAQGNDAEVIVWAAGEEDRVVTSDEANLRYSWFIITDAEGAVVQIGNNLVKASEGKEGFITEVTVPAGGNLIVFTYWEGDGRTTNVDLMNTYNDILLVNNNGAAIYNTVIDVESDYIVTVADGEVAIDCTAQSTTTPGGSDDDEDKKPGDMSNMIVFALLAVVAIAGSAVVIKTRR